MLIISDFDDAESLELQIYKSTENLENKALLNPQIKNGYKSMVKEEMSVVPNTTISRRIILCRVLTLTICVLILTVGVILKILLNCTTNAFGSEYRPWCIAESHSNTTANVTTYFAE